MKNFIVLIKSQDEVGLVYKISKLFADLKLNIVSNSEFVSKDEKLFFMRTEIIGQKIVVQELSNKIQNIILNGEIKIIDKTKRKKIILMVTKESHCLGDILIRNFEDELNADIIEVIGNYDNLKSLVEKFNIPFKLFSHQGLSREKHAEQILSHLENLEFDYIVLAKYMRILPPFFVDKFQNRIINIHHSFLPAFIGANPYKQAYERGVKIIGATAHFVTNELDEGPIIQQEVIDIDHTFTWKDMQKAGRDVEKIVLSKAVKLVLEDKVIVFKNKTVIF
jgi:formyltetrahydrofolate deformylase